MFNVTVLKMKDITKYLVGIIITIGVVVYTARYFYSRKSNIKDAENKVQIKAEKFSFSSLTGCLDKTIPTMSGINEEYNKIEKEDHEKVQMNYLEEMMKTEISTIKGIEELEKESKKDNEEIAQSNVDKQKENVNDNKEEEISLASKGDIKTEVVTQNPIAENYNVQYELLTVYLTNKTFIEMKNIITDANVKMNYITIYFGDNLFSDEQNIASGGKIVTNLVDSGDQYLTRSNLISKFLFEKNKIQ